MNILGTKLMLLNHKSLKHFCRLVYVKTTARLMVMQVMLHHYHKP